MESKKINKKYQNFLIVKITFSVLLPLIIYSSYTNPNLQNNHKEFQEIFTINIGSKGNISKSFEKVFDLDNKKLYSISYPEKTSFGYFYQNFNNLAELNVTKRTDLTEEIKQKLEKNITLDANKIYTLISFYIKKVEMNIENKKKLKVKEKYQNQLRKIEQLNNSVDKKKEINKILEQIGFYVPNQISYGGRIDITLEQNKNDIQIHESDVKKIFNFSSNSFLLKMQKKFKLKSSAYNVIGGIKDYFLKEKNLDKWSKSIGHDNSEIIFYNNIETINNFFDNDLKKKFIDDYKLYKGYKFTNGKYYGSLKKGKKEGFGKFEYNKNKYVYIGDWEDDKRNGEGSLYKDGELEYTGEWKDDLYDGDGKIFFSKKKWAMAKFKNGKCQKIIELSSNFYLHLYVWCIFN